MDSMTRSIEKWACHFAGPATDCIEEVVGEDEAGEMRKLIEQALGLLYPPKGDDWKNWKYYGGRDRDVAKSFALTAVFNDRVMKYMPAILETLEGPYVELV
jgi:hypothetical protein